MFKCPKCQNIMRWSEQLETDGNFFDGWIVETSLYHCEYCNKNFEVTIDAPIQIEGIEVDIRESDLYEKNIK